MPQDEGVVGGGIIGDDTYINIGGTPSVLPCRIQQISINIYIFVNSIVVHSQLDYWRGFLFLFLQHSSPTIPNYYMQQTIIYYIYIY